MAGYKMMVRGIGPAVDVKFVNMVAYEWDWERVDTASGDIQDHYHFDKLENLNPPWDAEDGEHWELVLVRDVFECEQGRPKGGHEELMDRTWAYPKDGEFPATFEDGTKVPKYKLAEYTKAKAI